MRKDTEPEYEDPEIVETKEEIKNWRSI